MPEVESTQLGGRKSSMLKALAPIITALLALIGSVTVAFLQARSASYEDINKVNKYSSSVRDELQRQTNEIVVPALQEKINSLMFELGKLDARVNALEKERDSLLNRFFAHRRAERAEHKPDEAAPAAATEEKFVIPKLNLPEQKVLEP